MAKQSKKEFEMLYEWGNEDLTRKVQQPYVRYFMQAEGPVLEIGCGRGAFLDLLQAAGIEAYGIDPSPDTVEYCRTKNHRVLQANAIDHLTSLPAGSLGGIFCGHVIEHLHPEQAVQLLENSARVLRPGARLVIITPNAKDLRTTERFWLDMTHVRPYPEKLLVSLLTRSGFTGITVKEGAEPYRNRRERLVKFLLRMWFMGYLFRGDLVVIATR